MIKNFAPRLYQETIFASASEKNTLVVLPTGLGKTNVFLMLASHRLKEFPNSKILFIGPTRPLIDQYYNVFREHFTLPEESYALFTGHVKPEKRAELWKEAQIIFSTPQGLENDIISRRIALEDVSLLGLDEAHRAVGDYSYVFVARQYKKLAEHERIIALTASPGSDMDKIKEVCTNLFIENIEVRTEEDADVKPYVQDIKITWVEVDLPKPLLDIKGYLDAFLKKRTEQLKTLGVLKSRDMYVSRSDILRLQGTIRGQLANNKDPHLWSAISILAEIMKMHHASELLETQGIIPLYNYLEKIHEESFTTKVKAVKSIVKDEYFKSARYKTQQLYEQEVEHPKLIALQKIVEEHRQEKIIIFSQYRDTVVDIKNKLEGMGVSAEVFVGQQKKGETGLSQKEQKAVLDRFREGEFSVLVATSIAEEGLDIPSVDTVIFYEPIPSAIRSIQRRGRTGRQDKGEVIMLMAKNTRDEGYRWSAHHKEKRMARNLQQLRGSLQIMLQPTLETYVKPTSIKIIADSRERGSGIIRELVDLGAQMELEQLQVGDYVLSNRCGVEFKTVDDFAQSIIDGRLLNQVQRMKEMFERPLIIIQGEEDIYSVRNIHANAVRGMLATITVSYGVPLLMTKHAKETASVLFIIAKREQDATTKSFSPHSEKRTSTLQEQQEYLVSAFPQVGVGLAKELLRHFGSVKKIVDASQMALEQVEKIGKVKAKGIRDVLDKEY